MTVNVGIFVLTIHKIVPTIKIYMNFMFRTYVYLNPKIIIALLEGQARGGVERASDPQPGQGQGQGQGQRQGQGPGSGPCPCPVALGFVE